MSERKTLMPQPGLSGLIVFCLLAVLQPARADGPPAPAVPTTPNEVLQQRRLEVLRREATTLEQLAQPLIERAAEAAQKLSETQSALKGAQTAKAEAGKRLADAKAAVEQVQQATQAAQKSLSDTATALKGIETQASADDKQVSDLLTAVEGSRKSAEETFAPLLALYVARKRQAEAASKQADEKLAKLGDALKRLTAEKTAADKAAAPTQSRAKLALATVKRFETNPPHADPQSLRLIETYKSNRPMIACRIDAAGRYLFAGAEDNRLLRWDLLTGGRTDLIGHGSWIRRIALDSRQPLLVSGSYAGRLIWWNPFDPSPEPLRTVEAHEGYVRAVAVSPDGRYVATGGNDALVKIWSAADGKLITVLSDHATDIPAEKQTTQHVYKNHVYNVAFSPNGDYLVSGDLVGTLKQWEVGTWKHVRNLDAGVLHKFDTTFRAHIGGIRGMDFSPFGRYLVVCGIGEVSNAFAGIGVPTAVLFDFQTGERLQVMKPAKKVQGTCWGVRFHPSGEFIVGAGGHSGGQLWFWKPGEEKSFHEFKLPDVGYDVAFHPDGLRMAVAVYDQTVRLYDLGPKVELAQAGEPSGKK